MRRRAMILGASLAPALAVPALAPRAAEPPRIAFLSLAPAVSNLGTAFSIDAFRAGLRDLGYVEGQNITIDYGSADGEVERLPQLIAEKMTHSPDVVVALGVIVAQAVKAARLSAPVVTVSADMVGSGLVASLARPGGNITGVSLAIEGSFGGKWLELIKEIAPRTSRIAYVWNPDNRSSMLEWQEMQAAAPRLGLTLQSAPMRRSEDLDGALAAVEANHAEAIVVDPDTITGFHRASLVRFALTHRLPLISVFRSYPAAGGLASYGPKLDDLWRRAAHYVDKILKGAKPADLPVEQPVAFELVINLKTAKSIGLDVPASLLVRADEVIE